MSDHDGWKQWSKFVLKELERLNLEIKSEEEKREAHSLLVTEKLDAMSTDVTKLKVKMTVIAAVIAALPALFELVKGFFL